MHRKYDLAGVVIGCAIEVHRHLGPGLVESPYERCLARELSFAGLTYERHKPCPVVYKGESIEAAFVPDLIVCNELIVEVKAVSKLADIHKQQVMTYLKLTGCKVGLIINFNVMVLTHGVKRIIYR